MVESMLIIEGSRLSFTKCLQEPVEWNLLDDMNISILFGQIIVNFFTKRNLFSFNMSISLSP